MTFSKTPSLRARLAAGAVAFAVVSGGALLTSAPAFADTTTPTETPADTASPTESTTATTVEASLGATPSTLTPEEAAAGASILLQGAGFNPEGPAVAVTVVQDPSPLTVDPTTIANDLVVQPDGTVNYTVVPELVDGDEGAELPEGVFTFTFKQGEGDDARTASADVTIAKAAQTPDPNESDDDAPLEPTAAPTQPVFVPSDIVTYNLANFTPGAAITISIDGPVVGSFEDTVLEDGTFPGEISYHEYDTTTGADLGRVDFPVGSYTVTITEAESDLTASFTFEVSTGDQQPADGGQDDDQSEQAQPSHDDATNANGEDQLAATGNDDVFGIAGLGLLVAGVGVAAIVLNRRLASKRAE